ncbi:MAG TPA: hypothetical protein VHG90_01005 [Acidimicrobiales bacterium]|nr:hypothetical protein [Acidimicrobiales bacterium]
MDQMTYLCPSCELTSVLFEPGTKDPVICPRCGAEIPRGDLVAGRDGVYAVRPAEAPEEWGGTIFLRYPDGSTSDLDPSGDVIRPGWRHPNGRHVLERFELTEAPIREGKFGVVGVLRDA